ncbi:hypothetical protein ACUNV4_15465 [Granulosicoccus sp. 3-233]|uniref:hypothetical protein n=1 Tax=Granulosicoccus sp. 3-233 TaxID=3417969 RepID=UPI003D34749F
MRLLSASFLFFALTTSALAANQHYKSGDLISVHWDSSYDYDDLQSMPATREVFDTYSGLNVLAINGTKSDRNSGILKGSSDIMRMVFPDGLDAFHDRSNTLHQAADRWQQTLRSGGTVHVAESGPSDFTADVIRELKARNVSALKNIRVVQHSEWNEEHTSSGNLALVKSATSYRKIDDGNRQNATAWLRTNRKNASDFQDLTSKSRYAHVWDTAFQAVTNSNRVVDFSDVVEILEILDVSTNRVADAFDFGQVYFGAASVEVPAPALPTEPEAPSQPRPNDEQSTGRVAVYGSSLGNARALYRSATSLRRVDCDPAGGGYVCASFQNPTLADTQGNASTDPVTNDEPSQVVVPTQPDTTVVSSGRVAVYGGSLSAARRAYAQITSLPRVDCDPSGSGYICASFRNPTLADIDGSVQDSAPSEPSTSPSDSAAETTTGNSLRIEVENHPLGSGWVKDTQRAGYSGNGYIRWSGANLYNVRQAGKGIMSFTVTPGSTGKYTLQLRSRALNPAASDLNNDVWLRMNGSSWMKIFNKGKDQWIVGGKVDAHGKRYVLKQNLTAGKTYQLEISGRSHGFAIDYIELVRN